MLLEKLAAIQAHYLELTNLIQANIQDYQKVADLSKEKAELEEIYQKSCRYQTVLEGIREAQTLSHSDDEEIRALAAEENEILSQEAEKLEVELKGL